MQPTGRGPQPERPPREYDAAVGGVDGPCPRWKGTGWVGFRVRLVVAGLARASLLGCERGHIGLRFRLLVWYLGCGPSGELRLPGRVWTGALVIGASPSRRGDRVRPKFAGHQGERGSPGSGDLRFGVSWRTSSRSRPRASISARTP